MLNRKFTLITGASEGFGKALAIECASRKINLVLVALPGPELNNLADFIKGNFGVAVYTIEKDLTNEDNCMNVYNEVLQLQLPVNTLINNAGLGSTMLFSEGSISFYQKQIKLNIQATTMLTHLFMDMLKKNGPSYILNVGSLSSYFYLPKKQVYGASKSFIYCFSKCLRRELNESEVSVSVICPGSMNTNIPITQLLKTSGWLSRTAVMNPEDVAPIAIDGLLNRKEVIVPGKMNNLFLLMNKILPSAIKKMMIRRQMNSIKSVTAAEQKAQTIPLTEVNN